MSDNKRIFYACQALAINKHGFDTYGTYNMVHGVQSVGINTNFNLEQAFELGQIQIYENIEGTPEVEVTVEKVMDSYPLVYLLATSGVHTGTSSGIAGRSAQRADLRLGIFDASQNSISAATDNSGKAEVEVYCSGMYVSNVSYSIPVEGNSTESVTFVGNNKSWLTGSDVKISNAMADEFDGYDTPSGNIPYTAWKGVQRREDVMMQFSVLPRSIKGVIGTTSGNGWNTSTSTPNVHIQSINISTDFSRDDILELGRKTPYFRPAGFPIEVTCEIEAITSSGDFVNAAEDAETNTSAERIFIALSGGITFDLGSQNRLSSVSYGGGDATGGNASCTYSFSNFNNLDVRQSGMYPVNQLVPSDLIATLYPYGQ